MVQQQILEELLSVEHQRLLHEQGARTAEQQQAEAATEALKADARQESKTTMESIKEQVMQLIQTLTHKAVGTHKAADATALVTAPLKEKKGQPLELVQTAMHQAATARAAQDRLQGRLTQALIQSNALKGVRKRQSKRIGRLERRVKEDEKTLAGTEPELIASRALVTQLKVQQQKSVQKTLALKSKLQEERSRRKQAERAAVAPVVHEAPVLAQTNPDAQTPSLHLGDKAKLSAALAAVTAAKAAMLHAEELAHRARASAPDHVEPDRPA